MTVEQTSPMTTSEPVEALILHVCLLSAQSPVVIIPS
jgi:hypothetical protein